jgi:PAS domain S-box-containing protein
LGKELDERKKTEKALREREQKFQAIFNQSFQFIGLMKTDGTLIEVNKTALSFVGLEESDVLNKPFWETPWWIHSPELQEQLREAVSKAAAGQFIRFEATHPAEDGGIHYVDFSLKPVKDEKGNVVLLIPEGRDITERKQAEEAIKTAYEQLEQANMELKKMQSQLVQNEKLASIGQLAAGVAHEMNTPVGFVASNFRTLENYLNKFLELLAGYKEVVELVDTGTKEERLTKLQEITETHNKMKIDFILEDIQGLFDESREGLDRVTSIVQNLRDFSRIDQPGSRDEYDINKGIEATLVVANNEIKYNADVKTDFSEVPLIFCHSGQINQVFLNILVNAAQAIKTQKRDGNGTITIRTHATETKVICEIEDDGPGIPPDKLSKIFDPFFTTKPVGKGTGLGLSVSYDIIVNKHNGKLLVDSTVGEGTKFTIKLPIGTKENSEKEKMNDGKENSIICG